MHFVLMFSWKLKQQFNMQGWNWVRITDSDDPLTWIVLQVRPSLIKVETCAETYILGKIGSVL